MMVLVMESSKGSIILNFLIFLSETLIIWLVIDCITIIYMKSHKSTNQSINQSMIQTVPFTNLHKHILFLHARLLHALHPETNEPLEEVTLKAVVDL